MAMYKKKQASEMLSTSMPCDKHPERQMCAYCMTCDDPICLRCLFDQHRHHECLELELAAKAKREILAKVEADIDDQLADLRLTMDEVQDLTKRAGTLRKRGSDVEVVQETGGLKAAFTNVTSLELNFEDTPGGAGQAGGAGRFVGGASKGGAGSGMSSCELAQHLMSAVPPGATKPMLVCHCWTDTAGCPASQTGRGANKTGGGANKTGAGSPFDSATNAGDTAARVAEAKEKDDKNANSRCRKIFDFDTKKGVCAGNTITKVDGRVFIADSMAVTGRINVYGQDGQYEKTIYNDEMKCPRGMAVAASPGNIVVCDSYCENGSQLVVISAADGKATRVMGKGKLKCASGIALTNHGNYVVSDTLAKCVHVFDTKGKHKTTLRAEFECPKSVAVCPDGHIVVCDTDKARVTLMDSDTGKVRMTYGSWGKGTQNLDTPSCVIADSKGNILIADSLNNRIHQLTAEGKFRRHLLTETDGISGPKALFFDKDASLLYVGHSMNKVSVYKYRPLT